MGSGCPYKPKVFCSWRVRRQAQWTSLARERPVAFTTLKVGRAPPASQAAEATPQQGHRRGSFPPPPGRAPGRFYLQRPPWISRFPGERPQGSHHRIQGARRQLLPTWCPRCPLASPRGTICSSCRRRVLRALPSWSRPRAPAARRPARLPDPAGSRKTVLGTPAARGRDPPCLAQGRPWRQRQPPGTLPRTPAILQPSPGFWVPGPGPSRKHQPQRPARQVLGQDLPWVHPWPRAPRHPAPRRAAGGRQRPAPRTPRGPGRPPPCPRQSPP